MCFACCVIGCVCVVHWFITLWGDSEISWEVQPAINKAGGLLCIWREQAFRLEKKCSDCGFIYLEGTWIADGVRVCIVNIYLPSDVGMERNLWDQIRTLRNANLGGLWCILGDFNSIRTTSERVGTSQRQQDERNIKEFNNWIADLEVDDVPCMGRKYTWYRLNGTAKSRLDRILVSTDWFDKWQGNTQFISERNFSCHCPILLSSSSMDWGPKPFRVLDCWSHDKTFRKVVSKWWSTNSIRGWGGNVLKEKIKGLKQRLKIWNKGQFGDIQRKMIRTERELNLLEKDGEERQLSAQEIRLKKQLQEELWVAASSHESLL